MKDKYAMRLVPTDRYGLSKDLDSGAIVSVDNAKLEAYKRKKAAFVRVDETSARIDALEDSVSEIKGMLKELLERTK